jgi:hypothetical protein
MLSLSDILIQQHELQSFDALVEIVRERALAGEMFFRMDVKPPFHDTPTDWEDRLEAVFTSARPR